MFAPDHGAAAHDLLRVCRPGGVIGLMSFTPGGAGGDFFACSRPMAKQRRPPRNRRCWGTEEHVKKMTRHEYYETAMSSRGYLELFRLPAGAPS